MQQMIHSFAGLRFVFVALVFMSHFEWCGIGAFDFGGDCGVAFFFVLSGYGLMSGYGARAAVGTLNFAGFVRRRLSRIYPMHLIALAVAFAAMPWAFADLKADILSVLLLQSWTSAYFAANGPAWFLSTLVFLYLLFPWLARRVATMRMRTLAAAAVVGIAFMAAAYSLADVLGADKDAATRWLYVFPPARVLDFFLGMVIFRICGVLQPKAKDLSSGAAFVLQSASMALVAALVPLYLCLGLPWQLGAIFWLPVAAVVCIFALTDGKALAGAHAMASRPLSYLGNISMEIFLLQVPVIAGMHRLAPHLPFGLSYGSALAASAAITLVVSAAVHRFVQRF